MYDWDAQGGRERRRFLSRFWAALFLAKLEVLDIKIFIQLDRNLCACCTSARTHFHTFQRNFEKRVHEKWVCMGNTGKAPVDGYVTV